MAFFAVVEEASHAAKASPSTQVETADTQHSPYWQDFSRRPF